MREGRLSIWSPFDFPEQMVWDRMPWGKHLSAVTTASSLSAFEKRCGNWLRGCEVVGGGGGKTAPEPDTAAAGTLTSLASLPALPTDIPTPSPKLCSHIQGLEHLKACPNGQGPGCCSQLQRSSGWPTAKDTSLAF